MNKFLNSTALAAGLAILGFAGSANATTVGITSQFVYDGSNQAPIFATVAPDSFTPTFTLAASGSSDGVERSPYQTNTDPTTPYSVLSPGGQPSPGSSATYNLGGSNTFEILWGSPDNYNFVDFYSGANGGGTLLATFSNGDLTCAACNLNSGTSIGWDDVLFTSQGGGIGSVVLRDTGQAAFEYGLNPAAIIPQTPLPAAAWLFGTVIAGAAGAARLRRRKA